MFLATLTEYTVDQNFSQQPDIFGGESYQVTNRAITSLKMMSSDDPHKVAATFHPDGQFGKVFVVMSQEEYIKLRVLAEILSE